MSDVARFSHRIRCPGHGLYTLLGSPLAHDTDDTHESSERVVEDYLAEVLLFHY